MTESPTPERGIRMPGRRAAREPADPSYDEGAGRQDTGHAGGHAEGHARGDTVERPAIAVPLRDGAPADSGPDSGPEQDLSDQDPGDEAEPEGHPVGTSLAGFFTGMAYVLVLPVLWWVLSDPDSPADLFSADLVYFVPAIGVPIVLTAVPRTRKFGRYMLLGVVLSAVVVIGVAALVLAFLIFTGR